MFSELLVKKTQRKKSLIHSHQTLSRIPLANLFYNPDEWISFQSYYRRYESIFKKDCSHWNDEKKVRLLFAGFVAWRSEA